MATIAADAFPAPPAFDPPPDWAVQDECCVDDPEVAQLLGRADSRRYLLPFMARPCTVQTAARHLQVKAPAMQYWVGRLQAAGLLRLWGVERRGRHRVQWFQAVARRWRVGLHLLPIETHEEVLACVSERFERLARHSVARSISASARDLEMTIAHGGAAGSAVGVQAVPGREVVDDYLAYWARLWLSEAEEGALRQELDALWDRYAALSRGGAGRRPVLLNLTQVRDRSV